LRGIKKGRSGGTSLLKKMRKMVDSTFREGGKKPLSNPAWGGEPVYLQEKKRDRLKEGNRKKDQSKDILPLKERGTRGGGEIQVGPSEAPKEDPEVFQQVTRRQKAETRSECYLTFAGEAGRTVLRVE